MEDEEAIKILKKLLDKYPLSDQEKAAVMAGIGALGWTKLGESRLKNIIRARKAEREGDERRADRKSAE